MSSQYGELWPTNGWDRFGSLGHPYEYQRVSRLGSITAWHSSSGRQPNIAALNRGRHLYSAGWPSRWALAHILVLFDLPSFLEFLRVGLGPFVNPWSRFQALKIHAICLTFSSLCHSLYEWTVLFICCCVSDSGPWALRARWSHCWRARLCCVTCCVACNNLPSSRPQHRHQACGTLRSCTLQSFAVQFSLWSARPVLRTACAAQAISPRKTCKSNSSGYWLEKWTHIGLVEVSSLGSLQWSDTVDWATRKASGL